MNRVLDSNFPISRKFTDLGIQNFEGACTFVKNLPYRRNEEKEYIFCVLEDRGGTCSTKHALLQRIATEINIDSRLMLGIFKMNATNTPKISAVLQKYHLKEMPEAHNYLKINDQIRDFTNTDSSPQNFIPDLLQEIEIQPDQITDFKIDYHQKFLEKYLRRNPQINYSLSAFWKIREECIAALQH